MAINRNRRIERAAINAFRSLLEAHDHIVQEIDGGNDHGEDLYVTFTENRQRTGDTIAVQVKGGVSRKAKGGYRIPVGSHWDYWLKSNVAIICVVQDKDTGVLYWANASQQLREAADRGRRLRSIFLSSTEALDEARLPRFVKRVRAYIAEAAELHRFLARISGRNFDTTDYLSYFRNEYEEQLIFQQRRGEPFAWLIHSDLGWIPEKITKDSIRIVEIPGNPRKRGALDVFFSSVMSVGDVVVDQSEILWIIACFHASEWYQKGPQIVATGV